MTAIIIEGPDRCGKSTQIKKIMQLYALTGPIQWLHYSAIRGLSNTDQTSQFKVTFNHMFELLKDDSATWLLDRSHIGERVYGPMYRPEIDTDYIWDLENQYKIHQKSNIGLILLYDSSFKNLERDDGDSYTTDLDKSEKEVTLFKRAWYETSIRKKIMIDIAGKNEDQVFEEIKSFIDFTGLRKLASIKDAKKNRPSVTIRREVHTVYANQS